MARMGTNQEKMHASLREEIQSGEAEVRFFVYAWIADMNDGRKVDGSLRSNGGQSREDRAISRNDAVRRGAPVSPQGRSRSEICWSNEEAAQGLASSSRATWRANGTDLRRVWILEEVCHCLQEGVPSCSSGTVRRKHPQENSDPGKLWTAEGIGCSQQEHDLLCKSGTALGTWTLGTQS
jgi:hypothetical protein